MHLHKELIKRRICELQNQETRYCNNEHLQNKCNIQASKYRTTHHGQQIKDDNQHKFALVLFMSRRPDDPKAPIHSTKKNQSRNSSQDSKVAPFERLEFEADRSTVRMKTSVTSIAPQKLGSSWKAMENHCDNTLNRRWYFGHNRCIDCLAGANWYWDIETQGSGLVLVDFEMKRFFIFFFLIDFLQITIKKKCPKG
ncbi:hypothetical protein RFI_13848 [Reticulomyxa filosa]|uniref:Uncharacterized protein n=1 Tax=Reticulomyxa filosa TaxID=46433 RepID=X6NAL3_RETFI|nr:hypothetical protein RFI_13848 [Reticulomyxa filosa]|eukprot:ETO23335.1 hypothetical protein RFI_13848 [Reticulomyxa filosa]